MRGYLFTLLDSLHMLQTKIVAKVGGGGSLYSFYRGSRTGKVLEGVPLGRFLWEWCHLPCPARLAQQLQTKIAAMVGRDPLVRIILGGRGTGQGGAGRRMAGETPVRCQRSRKWPPRPVPQVERKAATHSLACFTKRGHQNTELLNDKLAA